MARSIYMVPYQAKKEAEQGITEAILTKKGFRPASINTGEVVWKKGYGIMSATKFAKVEYLETCVQISAWIRVGVINFNTKEQNLTGIVAMVPKQQMKRIMDEVQKALNAVSPKDETPEDKAEADEDEEETDEEEKAQDEENQTET